MTTKAAWLPMAVLVALLTAACGSGFRKLRLDQIEECQKNCDPYPVAMWGAIGSSEACLCSGRQPTRD